MYILGKTIHRERDKINDTLYVPEKLELYSTMKFLVRSPGRRGNFTGVIKSGNKNKDQWIFHSINSHFPTLHYTGIFYRRKATFYAANK